MSFIKQLRSTVRLFNVRALAILIVNQQINLKFGGALKLDANKKDKNLMICIVITTIELRTQYSN